VRNREFFPEKTLLSYSQGAGGERFWKEEFGS
jgi:hypothetical protein